MRMWWQNLTLAGKIITFKTLALSKFVFLAQVLTIPNEIATTIHNFHQFKGNSYGTPTMEKLNTKLLAMIFKMVI